MIPGAFAVAEYAVSEFPGDSTPLVVIYGHCMNAMDSLFHDMHARGTLAFKMNARDELFHKMNARTQVCHECH